MANSASVSGSEGYNIPVNALDGGDAAPSQATGNSFQGDVSFQDGAFIFGNGNSVQQPESNTPSFSGLPGVLGGGGLSMVDILLIGGALLLVVYLVKRK